MNSEKSLTNTHINWYPGHMVKTKRQIQEDLKLIDVVIELIDARIPISSRNPEINTIIRDKKRIIILNKSDLADNEENKKWLDYFKREGTLAVLTDSNSGKGVKETVKLIEQIMKKDLEDYAKKGRVGKTIRVMILGIPNVGKSSYINRISNRNSAQVGNKPGVTRQKQWIRLNNKIELLDTPGVLWPKFENQQVGLHLSFVGTIKDEILVKTEIAYQLLKFLYQNHVEKLKQRYKINDAEIAQLEEDTIWNLMKLIGKKRGAILPGNKIDEEKVAGIILDDFRTTKIGKITIETI